MSFFFFNDTATTEIYTLSLHDALPIWRRGDGEADRGRSGGAVGVGHGRSEEHTSELQSHSDLVCRLLLEKKKQRSGNWSNITTSWRPIQSENPIGRISSSILRISSPVT